MENYEMKSRIYGSKTTVEKPFIEILEIPVKPEDTIIGLSLKYGCKLSELKRINKLICDQDLFALQKVKIPLVKHGFWHHQLSHEQMLSNVDDNDNIENDNDADTMPLLNGADVKQQSCLFLPLKDVHMKSITSSSSVLETSFINTSPVNYSNHWTSVLIQYKAFWILLIFLLVIPIGGVIFLIYYHKYQ